VDDDKVDVDDELFVFEFEFVLLSAVGG